MISSIESVDYFKGLKRRESRKTASVCVCQMYTSFTLNTSIYIFINHILNCIQYSIHIKCKKKLNQTLALDLTFSTTFEFLKKN